MSIPIGYHRIKTSSALYLTLLAENDPLTAANPSGAYKQVWDLQPSGIYWTIRNTDYSPSSYAYSTGVSGTSVCGKGSVIEWAIIPVNGVYSIQLAHNSSLAWNIGPDNKVNLGTTQLTNPMQQFTIE